LRRCRKGEAAELPSGENIKISNCGNTVHRPVAIEKGHEGQKEEPGGESKKGTRIPTGKG